MALHLYISDSLTQNEWEPVYEETLLLLDKFPLCEKLHKRYFGKDLLCLCKSAEREISHQLAWKVAGDYKTLKSADTFSLPRQLPSLPKSPAHQDVFLGLLPLIDKQGFKRVSKPYKDLWGHKTQGQRYKDYLLAIGVLIESRLKGKAALFGNYTLKELTQAVRLGNRYLKKPIALSDRCDVKKLFARISSFPISNIQKLIALFALHFGEKDLHFGNFVREHFTEKEIDAFWQDAFSKNPVMSEKFYPTLRMGAVSGFRLKDMSRYMNFTEHLGGDFYKQFVNEVIEVNLNLKRKEKRLTKEELKASLNAVVGQFCPVNQLLDFYLLQHKNPVNVRKKEETEVKRPRKKQPISTYLETELLDMIHFCNHLLSGAHFKRLMKGSPEDRCRFLMDQSHKLQFLEKDWKKIFDDVMKKEDAFRIYYPMAWLDDPSGDVLEMLKAIAFDQNVYLHVLSRKKVC